MFSLTGDLMAQCSELSIFLNGPFSYLILLSSWSPFITYSILANRLEIVVFNICLLLNINHRLFMTSSVFLSVFLRVHSFAVPSACAVHMLTALTHPSSLSLPQYQSSAGKGPSSTPYGWHLLLLPQAEVKR